MKREACRRLMVTTALLFNACISLPAVAATLSANPNPCVAVGNSPTCTTTLNWSGGPATAEVWTTILETGQSAQVDGGGQGSQEIPWIVVGLNYRFELRPGNGAAPLASVMVTGQPAPAVSLTASPNPCIAPPGAVLCTTTVQWSNAPASAELWTTILETGQSAQVNAGAQGSQEIPWIVVGLNYRFELRPGNGAAPLASVVVSGQAAPVVSLTASPNPCVAPLGTALCTTTVQWSNAPPTAQLWTTILETGQSALTAGGSTGNVSIPWIVVGKTYRFELRDPSTGALANQIVTGQAAAANVPPTVSLTANPTSGLVAPTTVTLSATAADIDGSVTRVQFFHGSTLLGEDTSLPFSWSWNITQLGTYAVTAVATDDRGANTSSAPVVLNVAGPGLGFSLPADYADFAPYRVSSQGFMPGDTQPTWRSVINGGGNVDIWWGGDREAHALRPNCRFTWVWGYGSAQDPYNVDTTKALLTVYHPSGTTTTDISRECRIETKKNGPNPGQPYALRVVDGVPYKIQVWGNIYGNSQAPQHRKRYFWEATYGFNPQSHNPCWTGPYPTRPVVTQQEAWWDSFYDGQQWHPGTWARGARGDIGADGEPNGQNVRYGTHWEIAYQAGYSWNLRWLVENHPSTCLQHN